MISAIEAVKGGMKVYSARGEHVHGTKYGLSDTGCSTYLFKKWLKEHLLEHADIRWARFPLPEKMELHWFSHTTHDSQPLNNCAFKYNWQEACAEEPKGKLISSTCSLHFIRKIMVSTDIS